MFCFSVPTLPIFLEMTAMKKSVLAAFLLALLVFIVVFDVTEYLTLTYFQTVRTELSLAVEAAPWTFRAGFFLVYVVVAALSIPGATVMTLAAGALFGFQWGLFLVSFASSIGATIAFLIARFFLGNWVQKRFEEQLVRVNEGIEREGNYYLFGLRMVPLVPFFAVNSVMGLTRMRLIPFYLVSQLGMLAGTAVYVFAGSSIGNLNSVADILNPGLVTAFALVGIFPFGARKFLNWLRSKRTSR